MPHLCRTMGGARVCNISDLIELMHQHLARFDASGDHRAAFLRVYATMTASVRQRMADGFFLDHAWVDRVAVRFAQWYFDAMDQYDGGQPAPPAWHCAFRAARTQRAFLLQDVLMGMNAHINNDLPQVIAAILRDEGDEGEPRRLVRRRFDHDQINRVLRLVIPTAEVELARTYGRLLRPLGHVMGSLDVLFATYGLVNWRDTVWRNAQFLLAAADRPEQQRVVHFIEADALRVAGEILNVPVLRWVRPLAPAMRRWHLG